MNLLIKLFFVNKRAFQGLRQSNAAPHFSSCFFDTFVSRKNAADRIAASGTTGKRKPQCRMNAAFNAYRFPGKPLNRCKT